MSGWEVIRFSLFHKVISAFCNKTIGKNKLQRCIKQNLNMTLQLKA